MSAKTFDLIYPTPMEWLWEGMIEMGEVTILCGDSGIGKSFLMADIAATVVKGGNLPGDPHDRRPAEVVMISLEDKPEITTVNRLIAAGLTKEERARVIDFTEVDSNREYANRLRSKFSLQDDLLALKNMLRSRSPIPQLVIIDPLMAATTQSLASMTGAREVMEQMQDVCDTIGVAMLVVAHPVKGRSNSRGTGLSIKDRIGGSKGITDAARQILGVERDRETGERLLSVVKSNHARDDLPPWRYRIKGDSAKTARVEWCGQHAQETVVNAGLPAEGTEAFKVWETIRDYRSPLRADELAALADVKLGTVRTSLSRLTDSKHVVSAGYGMHVAVSPRVISVTDVTSSSEHQIRTESNVTVHATDVTESESLIPENGDR